AAHRPLAPPRELGHLILRWPEKLTHPTQLAPETAHPLPPICRFIHVCSHLRYPGTWEKSSLADGTPRPIRRVLFFRQAGRRRGCCPTWDRAGPKRRGTKGASGPVEGREGLRPPLMQRVIR